MSDSVCLYSIRLPWTGDGKHLGDALSVEGLVFGDHHRIQEDVAIVTGLETACGGGE